MGVEPCAVLTVLPLELTVVAGVTGRSVQDQNTVSADEVEHLRHLGVPEFDGDRRIKRILEKPKDPPSHYGVTGIYFYPGDVFDVIAKLEPSGRGELEITDVNNWFIAQGAMEYDVLTGFWGDAGESIDAYYAVNDFVRQHGANKPQTPHPDPPPQGGREISVTSA